MSARDLHNQAEQLREKGQFVESLKLTDEALVVYQEESDWFGFCDVLGSRVLTLRHLFEKTGQSQYLVIAKHTAMAAVEIAGSHTDKSIAIMPYVNLARIQDTLGEFAEAAQNFGIAVDLFVSSPPKEHNRPAVLADLKVHIEVSKYKAGDKSALERAETALMELESAEEMKYNKDVWTSGGHMKIAEMLKTDKPEKAKEHLEKAKQVIDTNPELVLRKSQWEKLSKNFS